MSENRFLKAIEAFDQENLQDPRWEFFQEKKYPYEYLYSLWLTEWISKLDPHPSEALRLAARCQHLARFKIPRKDFPVGKSGYLEWRKALAQFHAKRAAEILEEVGYERETIERVQAINLKKNLKTDPEVQAMEDALCLVFLEHQFREFLQKTPHEKIPAILQKTWKKMSDQGRRWALKLPFSDEEKKTISEALGSK